MAMSGALVAICLVSLYVRYKLRNPDKPPQRWVCTAFIIFNQAQTLSIVGSLDLAWPHSVKQLLAALSLQLFSVPNIGCLLGDGAPPFWLWALTTCGLCFALLASLGLKLLCARRGAA